MNKTEVWNRCLEVIAQKVGEGIFDLWFKPIKVKHLKEGQLILEMPNRFYREWIEENYSEIISNTINEITGERYEVKYWVGEKQDKEQKKIYAHLTHKKRALRQKGVYLNPKYTFDEFVVGPSNQFAHAAAVKVSEAPGTVYNPLFIYGGVGLGKTHLISAIGNRVIDTLPNMKVIYVQSEQFTNEVVSAIRHDRMTEFKEKYRNVDLLLIDDIQFIANKASTQEEFFHTFNALYEQQKQIVISSDRPPKEIQDITDRLKSRFTMGLIADIQPPSFETKMAIIQKKAVYLKITVPEDVTQYLAMKVKSNIRDLEGCLLKLAAHSSLTGTPISLEMAKNVLKDMILDEDRPITIDRILKVVSDFYGVRLQDLKSKKKTKEIVTARQVAMYLCRQLTDLSLGDIGKGIGGKDHATVIYACRQVENRKLSDESFNRIIESMTKKIKEG
jgi:chromosomal replication initiator protein